MANKGTVWPFLQRMLPGRFMVDPAPGTTAITNVGNTTTTSYYITVPHELCKLIAVSVQGPTAAISAAGAVTLQVFKRTTSTGSPADVAITAATSIKSDVLTAAGSFDWPVTASDINSCFNLSSVTSGIGDLCRVDVVAAGSVDTQPVLHVRCEFQLIT